MDGTQGEVLVEVRERGRARLLIGLGVAHAVPGVAGAVLGYYACLLAVLPLPILVWLALRSARERLLFTTSGVILRRGRGSPALDDFAPWSALRRVELVVNEHAWRDEKTRTFSLTFDHGELEPLRWRLRSRPSPDELGAIARVCRDHGVEVGF